jgi:hypothetical protein
LCFQVAQNIEELKTISENITLTKYDVPESVVNSHNKHMESNKSMTETNYLQPISNTLLKYLMSESFNETYSLKNGSKLRFEFQAQLDYKACACCKESNLFLPINFNNSGGGKADIGIFAVVSTSEGTSKFPVLIGELKTAFGETDHLQLLNYMLTFLRPYNFQNGDPVILGFLMDIKNVLVFNLKPGNWTDSEPLSISEKRMMIKKIEFDKDIDSAFAQRYCFYKGLLEKIRDCLQELKSEDVNVLLMPRSPTLLFPTPLNRKGLSNNSSITSFLKSDWDRCKDLFGSINDHESTIEFEQQLGSLKNDEKLVLKVFGPLFAGGGDIENLFKLLKDCLNSENSCLKEMIVHRLYLGVYQINSPDGIRRDGIRFALTRLIEGANCSTTCFKDLWSHNRNVFGEAFIRYVFTVAFDAIEMSWYHWDIRAPNLIFDDANQSFVILDWESIVECKRKELFEDLIKPPFKQKPLMKIPFTLAEFALFRQIVLCVLQWDLSYLSFDVPAAASNVRQEQLRRVIDELPEVVNGFFDSFEIPQDILKSNWVIDTSKRRTFYESLMKQCLCLLPPERSIFKRHAPLPSVSLLLPPLVIARENQFAEMVCGFSLQTVYAAGDNAAAAVWTHNNRHVDENDVTLSEQSSSPSPGVISIEYKLEIDHVTHLRQGIYCCKLGEQSTSTILFMVPAALSGASDEKKAKFSS